jgi:hypothetical protein
VDPTSGPGGTVLFHARLMLFPAPAPPQAKGPMVYILEMPSALRLFAGIGFNAVLLVLSAAVAYMRWAVVPL